MLIFSIQRKSKAERLLFHFRPIFLVILMEMKSPHNSPDPNQNQPKTSDSSGADKCEDHAGAGVNQKQHRAGPAFCDLYAKGKAYDQRHINHDQIVLYENPSCQGNCGASIGQDRRPSDISFIPLVCILCLKLVFSDLSHFDLFPYLFLRHLDTLSTGPFLASVFAERVGGRIPWARKEGLTIRGRGERRRSVHRL